MVILFFRNEAIGVQFPIQAQGLVADWEMPLTANQMSVGSIPT